MTAVLHGFPTPETLKLRFPPEIACGNPFEMVRVYPFDWHISEVAIREIPVHWALYIEISDGKITLRIAPALILSEIKLKVYVLVSPVIKELGIISWF